LQYLLVAGMEGDEAGEAGPKGGRSVRPATIQLRRDILLPGSARAETAAFCRREAADLARHLDTQLGCGAAREKFLGRRGTWRMRSPDSGPEETAGTKVHIEYVKKDHLENGMDINLGREGLVFIFVKGPKKRFNDEVVVKDKMSSAYLNVNEILKELEEVEGRDSADERVEQEVDPCRVAEGRTRGSSVLGMDYWAEPRQVLGLLPAETNDNTEKIDEETDEASEYEVEELLEYRAGSYLVKWVGWPVEERWEPGDSIYRPLPQHMGD
jgi:hypothetical protein